MISDEDESGSPMLMLDEQAFAFVKLPDNIPMKQHPAPACMSCPHDHFGPLDDLKAPSEHLIVMPQQLPIPELPVMPVLVAATFPDCRVNRVWNPLNDHLLVGIQGPTIPRKTMADFWAGLLSLQFLDVLPSNKSWFAVTISLLMVIVGSHPIPCQ